MNKKKIIYLVLLTTILMVIIVYNFSSPINKKEKQKLDTDFQNSIYQKSEKIEKYILEKKELISILSESEEITNILKSTLEYDPSISKNNIRKKSLDSSKEIEAYLMINNEYRLKEANDVEEFIKKIIRIDEQIEKIYIHPHSEKTVNYFDPIKDLDMEILLKDFPNFHNAILQNKGEYDVAGGYYWEENESGRIKATYISPIKAQTKNDERWSLSATAYLDEYKTINEISESLTEKIEKIQEQQDNNNLFLISKEGYIIYMSKPTNGLGMKLGWWGYPGKNLIKNFQEIQKNKNTTIFGPFFLYERNKYPKISIMTPIYENENFLGAIALIVEPDKIYNILKESSKLKNETETYLIDENLYLISPLNMEKGGILVQVVDTENSQNCIKKKELTNFNETQIFELIDWAGDNVIGTNIPLKTNNWCLLSEIKEDILLQDYKNKKLVINGIIFIIFIILALILIKSKKI